MAPVTRERFGAEDESRGVDEIAADVEERAAADLRLVADVVGIAIGVAEGAEHRSNFADSSLSDQILDLQPLRVRADHEGFLDAHAGAIAHRQEVARLGSRQPDGLLAEDVLAVFGRLDRPGDVEVIGQRIVNRVDLRVGEEFLV